MSSRRDPELYPIRTVSALTGVNPATLRAWERRYQLIRPQRSPGGQRLYSRRDIDRIQRAVSLLAEGASIGKVAARLERSQPAAARGGAEAEWATARSRLLDAVARFDEATLSSVYNDAMWRHSTEQVDRCLLLPLLQALGERWQERSGAIAEEHFFSGFLRNALGARLRTASHAAGGPRIVAACLPEEAHDLGLLMFAVAASGHGYRVVMLGARTPLASLGAAIRGARAVAVVLSGSVEPPREVLAGALRALVGGVEVPVFVGGAVSMRHAGAIENAGAIALGQAFEAALRRMDQVLRWRARRPRAMASDA